MNIPHRIELVQALIKSNNVKKVMAKARTVRSSDETIISGMVAVASQYGTKNAAQLSAELGVKKERIQAWATNLRAMGVKIPKLRRTGIYLKAFQAIKDAHPSLIDRKALKAAAR